MQRVTGSGLPAWRRHGQAVGTGGRAHLLAYCSALSAIDGAGDARSKLRLGCVAPSFRFQRATVTIR